MRQALLLLALLAGFSSSVFAEDYYWYMVDGDRYPSPQAACSAYVAKGYPVAGLRNAVAEAYVLPMDTKISFRCLFYNQVGEKYGRLPLSRGGDTCSGSYDTNTGICTRPSDAECKTRGNYTKTIQFSYTDGGAVLELDPEIKDGCVYEPGTPDSCDDNVCTVDMIPVGNDDMSDNPDNPDQQLQDYLDELAKKFECSKTANGTVGCTGAQTTPPDIDPDDKCPDGYSWSGSACFPTTGGGNENPDGSGGNTGGGDGGNNGGDGGSNPGTGNGDGGGSTGGGTGGGDGGTNGGDGPKESLEQPKQGNWDDALSTWEAKVAEAKKEFSEKIKENADQLKGVFDLNLGEGGGKLPCDTFVVWKKTVSLCFTPYEEKLSYLRYALMFMASVLAAFVILKE
ncbi:hypothetical protein [Pseudomonas sp. PDM19]|uniref:hypothetical protein n=1 Tax=Pseudomonas sp. PDM19 TaxID=2769272 RepID=UPI0017835E70|nr:hypothetical protein [Pseudomonas sp. PDM19]MBD9630642.1 hypothetical protein [Pseudomonas sp. PDM19]